MLLGTLFFLSGQGAYDFTYNSPSQFKSNLAKEVAAIKDVIGSSGKFSLAIPIAASCHEYEAYVKSYTLSCYFCLLLRRRCGMQLFEEN